MEIADLFLKENGRAIPKITPGYEWVLNGEGEMSVHLDGQCIKKDGTGPTARYLKRMKSNDGLTFWIEMRRDDVADKALWEAIDFDKYATSGIYVALGPDIKGNTQNVSKHMMYRVLPVEYKLILKYGTNIKRGPGYSVDDTFQSFQKEFADPQTDAEGVVFHKELWEKGTCTVLAAARVLGRDFGASWPKPKKHVCKFEEHTAEYEICRGCGTMQSIASVVGGVHGPGWNSW